jgi:type I restriction enzyme S subunit
MKIKNNPTLSPKLRFPEFLNSPSWIGTKLGDQSSILKGKGISKADVDENGEQPCIRYGELYTRYDEVIKTVFLRTKVPASELFLSRTNDVIIPASGETKIDIAKASCVLCDNVALGGDLNVIRSGLNGIFLSYYLNGPKKLDIAKVAQGDTVVHLYPSQLEKLEIAIPLDDEQQKIASCLSSLDELIAAHSQKLDALKTHKKGLMQQLFPREGETIPHLRFPEFEDAGEWEDISLGEKVDLLSGYPFDGPDISQDRSGTRLLRGINVTEGRIRHNPEIDRYYTGSTDGLEKYRLHINDLIIGMDGSKVGKNSALVTAPDSGSLLIQRVARLRANNPALIQFIFQRINSTTFHSYVDRINTSSGIPHISAKQIKDFRIYFPSDDEQQRIASCLSTLDELIAAQTQKLDALKTHKKGLMQQLFPSPEEVEA